MATEKQSPGGAYVNETATRQAMLPDGTYINETVAAAAPSTGQRVYGGGSGQRVIGD